MIKYIHPSGHTTKEEDKKFSVDELKKVFGDRWYTLSYANTENNADGTTTDYLLARLDTYGMQINELPAFNEYATQLFGRECYGVAILAPAHLF